MHNENSSRFSKYISVTFDAQSKDSRKIVGFETKTYLLEKSRAVFSAPDERKFHFVYSLDKAFTSEQKDKYKFLQNFGEYAYLSESINTKCTNDDVKVFQDVMQTFKVQLRTDPRSLRCRSPRSRGCFLSSHSSLD